MAWPSYRSSQHNFIKMCTFNKTYHDDDIGVLGRTEIKRIKEWVCSRALGELGGYPVGWGKNMWSAETHGTGFQCNRHWECATVHKLVRQNRPHTTLTFVPSLNRPASDSDFSLPVEVRGGSTDFGRGKETTDWENWSSTKSSWWHLIRLIQQTYCVRLAGPWEIRE